MVAHQGCEQNPVGKGYRQPADYKVFGLVGVLRSVEEGSARAAGCLHNVLDVHGWRPDRLALVKICATKCAAHFGYEMCMMTCCVIRCAVLHAKSPVIKGGSIGSRPTTEGFLWRHGRTMSCFVFENTQGQFCVRNTCIIVCET